MGHNRLPSTSDGGQDRSPVRQFAQALKIDYAGL
jgi:hypothetical protein